MTTTIAGRPVRGEITRYGGDDKLPPQKPIDDFVAALDLIFALGATGIWWRQCTPYFNDGDPCVFRIGEVAIKFPDSPEDAGDYENGFESEYEYRDRHKLAYEVFKDHLSYQKIKAYNVALNEAFGDPAEVTATLEGFDVEYYEHD